MWPALAKQGTCRQLHPTDLRFNIHQQCMGSDNQLDQYFQFVKDLLLEEVVSEPLIYSAYYVNQNLPTYHSGFGKIMQLCT